MGGVPLPNTVRAPYSTISGRDCVKSLRLCLHGTCPQKQRGEQLKIFERLLPESQGQNLAMTEGWGIRSKVVDIPLGLLAKVEEIYWKTFFYSGWARLGEVKHLAGPV